MAHTKPVFRMLKRAGALCLLLFVVLGAAASPASAHAVLIDTVPAGGALLSAVPNEVSITFNETVLADDTAIVVVGQDGKAVNEPAAANGATVTAQLKGDLSGWYAVSWHVVSADGHPISGAYTFRVGVGPNAVPQGLIDQAKAGLTPDASARYGWAASQFLSSLSIVVLAGTIFMLAVIGTNSLRNLTILALIVGVIAAFTSILAAGFNGPQVAPNIDLFNGPASPVYLFRGAAAGLATLLIALGASRSFENATPSKAPTLQTATTSPLANDTPIPGESEGDLHNTNDIEGSRNRQEAPEPINPKNGVLGLVALAVALVGVGVSIRSGHAFSKGGIAYVAVTIHLVFAACWLGAIPALALSIRQTNESARVAFARFSRQAAGLVAVVFVSGAVGTLALSGGISNIARTWGLLMVAKVALVFVAVVIGAWNRWNVLPFWQSLHKSQILAPTILESTVLVLVVALSISILHNGPPSQVVIDSGPVTIVETIDDLNIQMVIDPGKPGTNDLHLYVTDLEGKAVPVEDATITYSSPDLGIGNITPTLSNLGFGHFSARVSDLGVAGKWDVNVLVRPDTFSQVELNETVEIR